MATTTTNFGWDIPQSTDLVKDGATAIAALGQDIDTALVDLKGGTTGQVLAKASGTDLDFSWSTPSTASGFNLIATTSFSNVASQAFDNVFTSTYKSYIAVINNISAGGALDDLQLQFRYAGPTTQTASYYGSCFAISPSGSTSATASNNSSQLTIADQTGSATAPGGGQIFFSSVGNSSIIANCRGQYNDASGNHYVFGAQVNEARTYTGFLLKTSSSNITGSVSIYGLGF